MQWKCKGEEQRCLLILSWGSGMEAARGWGDCAAACMTKMIFSLIFFFGWLIWGFCFVCFVLPFLFVGMFLFWFGFLSVECQLIS